MNSRKKPKKPNMILILGIFLVILILISVLIKKGNNKNNKYEEKEALVDYEKIVEIENQDELQKIKQMNERTRIEYYVSKYIKLIENGNYDEAYKILNKDYKNRFFKTKKEFIEYCENTFPTMADISYNNFERNGEFYVLWITMGDAVYGSKDTAKEMNFVVKENTFNDYELSFSKI